MTYDDRLFLISSDEVVAELQPTTAPDICIASTTHNNRQIYQHLWGLHFVAISCRDLSGGEVYRFAMAMALARGCGSPTPPVLLLDDMFDRSDKR